MKKLRAIDNLVYKSDSTMRVDHSEVAQVLLVYMPFGSINTPALGISLLKETLTQRGIACDISYLTIPFAERIGLSLYYWVSIKSLRTSLVGERIFAGELFAGNQNKEPDNFEDVHFNGDKSKNPANIVELLQTASKGVRSFLDESLASVPWEQYSIIGFSTSFQQNTASLALASRIKEKYPNKTIVFGGANCEDDMGLELHRQFKFIDYVCRGESDVLFPTLVEHLLSGSPIPNLPGLVMRRGGQSKAIGVGALPVTDLDKLPYPNYDDYFQQLGESSLNLTGQLQLLFETSRGCWYGAKRHCTFCGLNDATIAFRSKSPDRALDELLELSQRYGIKRLLATDAILDNRYFHDFIPKLIAKQPDLSIFYEVKANLRKDQMQLLRQAGVDSLQPGLESLSTSILKLMRKGCTVLQNVQLLKWAGEFGIDIYWNLIKGFPGEEPEEYDRMVEMIPGLLHLQPPSETDLRLDRFSPYFDDPQAFGITNVRAAAGYRMVYPFPEAVLTRLAYHFDYDHADGRETSVYTKPLSEMIAYWRDHYSPGALTSLSTDRALIIHDRRSGAKQLTIVELTGAERAVYEYCDEAHPLSVIHKHTIKLGYEMDEEALGNLLEHWVGVGLMLRDGDWFLSLAVSTDDWWQSAVDSDMLKQAFTGALVDTTSAARANLLE